MTCVIPAKSDSSRLPGKNFKKIHGHSLVEIAIAQANETGFRPLVVGDAGWKAIKEWPVGDYEYLERKPEWSDPEKSSLWVAAQAVIGRGTDILLLQPTSPARSNEDIERCV